MAMFAAASVDGPSNNSKACEILRYLPMSRGSNEVETAVHSGVGHDSASDARLRVEVLLVLAVDVVYDRLPAAEGITVCCVTL